MFAHVHGHFDAHIFTHASGNELFDIGEADGAAECAASKIVDTNRPTLHAELAAAGAEVLDLGIEGHNCIRHNYIGHHYIGAEILDLGIRNTLTPITPLRP